MRILQIVNDLSTGGAQTLVAELARELGARHELHLLVLAGPGPLSDRLAGAVGEVEYLGLPTTSRRVDHLVTGVRDALRRIRPDVAHSHLLHADFALAVQQGRIPKVSTVHTSGRSSAKLRSQVLARVCARLGGRFTAVVACSDAALTHMRAAGYPARHREVIGNGVAVPAAAAPATGGRDLVCLSRWHPMKDHGTLFAAVRAVRDRHPDTRLVCAGSGMTPDNPELVALIARAGLSDVVRLRGPVPDVTPLIRYAGGLVISSAYGEALPMAGAEALAQGRPVVTTDVGSSATLAVAPWLVVPPRDPGALGAALTRLLELDGPAATGLSRAAHALARREFGVARTATRYEAVYDRAVGGTP